MTALALIRRTLLGLAGTALGVALMVVVAHADQGAGDPGERLRLHGPAETLRDFCERDANGTLWLKLPGGQLLELIESVDHPSIANRGDGDFHAFDEATVRAALHAVRYPLGEVQADIFILPYPRRGALESGAAPGVMLLSPGTRSLTPEHQHAEVVHELGHLVHHALMRDLDQWERYRKIRGIESIAEYSQNAPHNRRPHEIFAEDFRALFGGALANYSGTIENASLTYPTEVLGLSDFMLSLAGATPATASRLVAYPNPSRGALTFSRGAGDPVELDIFDAQGRRVMTLQPTAHTAGFSWTWDGRDDAGRIIGPGTLFARAREAGSRPVRVTILP